MEAKNRPRYTQSVSRQDMYRLYIIAFLVLGFFVSLSSTLHAL